MTECFDPDYLTFDASLAQPDEWVINGVTVLAAPPLGQGDRFHDLILHSATKRLARASDEAILEAHERAQEGGVCGVMFIDKGVTFAQEDDRLKVYCHAEIGSHPDVPLGEIHYQDGAPVWPHSYLQ